MPLAAEPEAGMEERVAKLEEQNAQLMAEIREMKDMLMKQNTDVAEAKPEEPRMQAEQETKKPAPGKHKVAKSRPPQGEPRKTARTTTTRPDFETRLTAIEDDRWTTKLNENGGGLEFSSPDEWFRLRLLAYAQAQATFTDGANDNSFEDGDFRVRRARVDWLADFGEDYQLFIELDGAASDGASLVEARLNARLLGDALQVRAGKFTTPFSAENFRSSRSIDTVERYIALNSMFSLPGLDVQNGAMLWGTVPVGAEKGGFAPSLTYYLGAYNGNSSAGSTGNVRDSNGDKEVQAKLVYKPLKDWSFGLGFDHNQAEDQTLTLASLSGTPFIQVPAGGKRTGGEADFLYEPGRFSLRGEGLYVNFSDADVVLYGGFLQMAYFLSGDAGGGFQPVLRVEAAQLEGGALNAINGSRISAVTAGFNWFLNGNVRLQLNYVGEYFDGTGNASVGSESFRNSVLTQLQMKF